MVLLHHPVAKVKRQKLLNTEIKKVRRKLSMDKASQKSQKGKFCILNRFRCLFATKPDQNVYEHIFQNKSFSLESNPR